MGNFFCKKKNILIEKNNNNNYNYYFINIIIANILKKYSSKLVINFYLENKKEKLTDIEYLYINFFIEIYIILNNNFTIDFKNYKDYLFDITDILFNLILIKDELLINNLKKIIKNLYKLYLNKQLEINTKTNDSYLKILNINNEILLLNNYNYNEIVKLLDNLCLINNLKILIKNNIDNYFLLFKNNYHIINYNNIKLENYDINLNFLIIKIFNNFIEKYLFDELLINNLENNIKIIFYNFKSTKFEINKLEKKINKFIENDINCKKINLILTENLKLSLIEHILFNKIKLFFNFINNNQDLYIIILQEIDINYKNKIEEYLKINNQYKINYNINNYLLTLINKKLYNNNYIYENKIDSLLNFQHINNYTKTININFIDFKKFLINKIIYGNHIIYCINCILPINQNNEYLKILLFLINNCINNTIFNNNTILNIIIGSNINLKWNNQKNNNYNYLNIFDIVNNNYLNLFMNLDLFNQLNKFNIDYKHISYDNYHLISYKLIKKDVSDIIVKNNY